MCVCVDVGIIEIYIQLWGKKCQTLKKENGIVYVCVLAIYSIAISTSQALACIGPFVFSFLTHACAEEINVNSRFLSQIPEMDLTPTTINYRSCLYIFCYPVLIYLWPSAKTGKKCNTYSTDLLLPVPVAWLYKHQWIIFIKKSQGNW